MVLPILEDKSRTKKNYKENFALAFLEVRYAIKLNYLTVPKMRQCYLNFLDDYFEKIHLPKKQIPKEVLTAIEQHFGKQISSLKDQITIQLINIKS